MDFCQLFDFSGKDVQLFSLQEPFVLLLLTHQAGGHHCHASGQEEESINIEEKYKKAGRVFENRAKPALETYSAVVMERPVETPAVSRDVIKETSSAAYIEKPVEIPSESTDITKETTEHMNDTSDQTMDCKCEQCDFIDKTEKGLKQHIAKKHNVIDVKNVASTALHKQT